jgi:hypothetical protein
MLQGFTLSVPKLNGTNYHDWKFACAMALRHQGVFGVATGSETRPSIAAEAEKWDTKDEKALSIIGLTVETSQYVHIRSCTKSADAWQAFKDLYEKNSQANRITLKRAFYTFKHDPERPIRDFINGIMTLTNQLKALGVSLSDEDVIDVIIYALHSDWSNIAGTLTASQATLRLADVVSGLVDEEARRNPAPEAPESGMKATLTHGGKRWEDRRTCYAGGKRGHITANCRSKDSASGTNGAPEKAGFALDQGEYAF